MKKFLLLAALVTIGDAANILGVFVFPSKSHHLLGSILLGNLAKRGHNVTFISPFKSKNNYPNFTHIVVDDILKYNEEHLQKNNQKEMSYLDNLSRLTSINSFQDIFFESQKIKCFLKSDTKFDLMIHFVGVDATLALAHHFDVPVMLFAPLGGMFWVDSFFGNPIPIAYRPGAYAGAFSDQMNFSQRLINIFVEFLMAVIHPIMRTSMNKAIQKYLPEAPAIEEIENRIEMVLINSHVSTETPRPYLPAMVQIGGYHLQEPEALPEDLKKTLDEATNGTIYFSFGTNVKISDISGDKLDIIMTSLGRLPMKVLMKFDEDTFDNKPDNVEVRAWLPQRGVLSHPNVKLFISHGGVGGATETLYYGVPMICIPFSLDQPKNCADAERHGYGIHLPFNRLTTDTFSKALEKVLHDEKFIAQAKFKSELYRDQEMNPMDKAEYWVNHVIKHKGAKHLRAKALDLAWYEYYLLDIIGFVLFVLMGSAAICYYVLKFFFNGFYKWQEKVKTC